jgi:hypothetical protein
MTDDTEGNKPGSHQFSSAPLLPPTIEEESNSTSTITALINSNPLVDPDIAAAAAPTNITTPRTRRRSSISILQSIVNSNHLLPTNDARKR